MTVVPLVRLQVCQLVAIALEPPVGCGRPRFSWLTTDGDVCDACCPTRLSDTILVTQRMATRDNLTKKPAASFVRQPRRKRLYRLFAISLTSCAVVDDTAYSRGVKDHAEGADDQAIGLNIDRQD